VANEGRPGRPESPLDPASGAVANLAARLRQLREDAGRPSYRRLARTAHYSHSALSQAAAGRVLPSLAVTLAFAQACGGDPQEWTAWWHEAETGVLAELEAHAADAASAMDVVARQGIRGRLALVRRRGWYPGRHPRLPQHPQRRVRVPQARQPIGPVGSLGVLRGPLGEHPAGRSRSPRGAARPGPDYLPTPLRVWGCRSGWPSAGSGGCCSGCPRSPVPGRARDTGCHGQH